MNASPSQTGGQKLFVIAKRSGRMGNQLVLFANIIAYAEEHGHRVINTAFYAYAHLFETTSRDIYGRYPAPQRRSVFDASPGVAARIRKSMIFYRIAKYAGLLNSKLPWLGTRHVTLWDRSAHTMTALDDPATQKKIAPARVIFLHSWGFRAPGALEKHAVKVRSFFRPLAATELKTRTIIGHLRQQADVVVGVHIRHGDYREYCGGKYFYEVSRYAAWMQEMTMQFPGKRVAFFVSSEEPRRREEFGDLVVELAAGSPVEDLYTLAGCDFVMGPPSTFSQWASFYGGSPLQHFFSTEDHAALGKFHVSFLKELP